MVDMTRDQWYCHTCRTLQCDNRLICWSLEELLAWVRENHMDQQEIRDHIDLMLGKYRQELESRQSEQPSTAIEDITPEGAAIIQQAKAQATAAENKRVLDELATMYENVPDRFLDGTYRLHSEWRDKIESLRAQPEPKERNGYKNDTK